MAITGIGYTADTGSSYDTRTQNMEKGARSPAMQCIQEGNKKVSLCLDALISYANPKTGESVNIYHARDYSKENPVYVLKGLDAEGSTFEQEVNAAEIDPNHCSYNEWMVLNQETGNTSPSDYLHMAAARDKAGTNSLFEQADYLSAVGSVISDMKTMGNWSDYLSLDKWMQSILDYSAKKEEDTSHSGEKFICSISMDR